MSNRIDFRTDTEVLLDHLADLARQIRGEISSAEQDDAKAERLIDEIRALAAAQLVLIEQYNAAMAREEAEAAAQLKAMCAKVGLGMSDAEFRKLFPPETNGRLAPPKRVFFPNVVDNTAAARAGKPVAA